MSSSATESESAGGKDSTLWEAIRDQLIEKIRSGTYGEGVPLPSISAMTVEWSVSTTTARKVLSELVAAGYAESRGTRGYFSRGPNPTPAQVTPTEPEGSVQSSPSARRGSLAVRTRRTVPAHSHIAEESVAVDVRREQAPGEVAVALRLADPSERLIVQRTLVQDDRGVPVEFRVTYMPDPAPAEPEIPRDALDLLTDYEQRAGRMYLITRHPTDTEATALAVTPTTCVFVRTNVIDGEASDSPTCYSETVWPGESIRLALNTGTQPPA